MPELTYQPPMIDNVGTGDKVDERQAEGGRVEGVVL
jgi:hypothetical protein